MFSLEQESAVDSRLFKEWWVRRGTTLLFSQWKKIILDLKSPIQPRNVPDRKEIKSGHPDISYGISMLLRYVRTNVRTIHQTPD